DSFIEHKPVEAVVGSDVILPCVSTFNISLDDHILEWNKDDEEIYTVQDRRGSTQVDDYKDRTSLINGNVSLKVSRVTPSDTGKYRCYLPSIHQEAVIELNVGKSYYFNCHSPSEAVVGSDVILPCVSTPVECVVNDADGVHLYHNEADDPEAQIEDYKGRTALSHNNLFSGDCSLSLRVKTSDAGTYRCSVITEKLPPPSCSLNLIGKNTEDFTVMFLCFFFVIT
uniref:Ig-like domain-containing protein n=1 Tax=Anabas testudineus TaxID=64144 RepID=A0A3Q1IDF4_ANATE